MKKIIIKTYKFDELSKEAQQKVLEKFWNINVSNDWWDNVCEDAKKIGLKIKEFDIDSNTIKFDVITSSPQVAESILKEHGEKTNTYQYAKKFIEDLEKSDDESKLELHETFDVDIAHEYLDMLQTELDYKTSKSAIIETIEANEYWFSKSGDDLPILTIMNGNKVEKYSIYDDECTLL